MAIAAILNTCSLESGASAGLSSGGVPHGDRAWLLRNVILPAYTEWFPSLFSEVVVVGSFEAGPGYTYVPCPSVYRSCADALAQRDAGFAALTKPCEWALFQHDDHLWDPRNIVFAHEAADVLSPSRWTRGRSVVQEQLNDGHAMTWTPPPGDTVNPDVGQHLNGHACLMRPSVFRDGFRWSSGPAHFIWDAAITVELQRLGKTVRYAPELKTYDMERGSMPWL